MWKYLLLVLLACGTFTAQAQPGNRAERFDRIKAAREAFLKERLDLTEQESEAFFPVFWQYDTKIRKGRREGGPNRRGGGAALEQLSEQEAKEWLLSNRKRQREMLALEAEAEDAYLQVLPAKKVVLLRRAERAFREKLLSRLREERRGGGRN